jgi:hypothetical protein
VKLRSLRRLALPLILLAAIVAPASRAATVLGTQSVQPQLDQNAAGRAEAFKVVATGSGTVTTLQVYVDAPSAATKLIAGLYANNGTHPGALLAQGTRSTPTSGAWNQVDLGAGATVTSGTTYWIAILSPTGTGTIRFRDAPSSTVGSETSSSGTLAALPTTWSTGTTYRDASLSAYGVTSSAPAPPVLSVTPSTLSFTATTGGANPASRSITVSNTGGGSLNFTAADDAPWLSVTPASGSAPATLQASVSVAALSAGLYSGLITINAPGIQGSPATVSVSLTIADPLPPPPPSAGDWLQVDHDSARLGDAVDESGISPAEAPNLTQLWSTNLDGKITAQPLFVGGVSVGGQSRDVVVATTNANSVYAIDATTGVTLWRRNFGAVAANCAIPGGFGIAAPPAIDRVRGQLYVVTDGGQLRTLNLTDGSDAAAVLALIPNPSTNKVWGGLNLVGSMLYVATASDGCDTPPWRGAIYRVDVSGTTPISAGSWSVVPGIAAPNGGGGIWGYGGVSVDSVGRVYAATAADSNEQYQPYADRLVVLDATLTVLGSFEPTHPTSYPCNGSPCDVDFGATPVVFQPTGCPPMLAAGNKDGNLYVMTTSTLAASGNPEQTLRLNPANDWLGNGGVGGVPAYWAAGRMLFVSDAGAGFGGTSAGVVGLSIDASCRAGVTWSRSVGLGGGNPNSTPTVANGVVYVGEGDSGTVYAFDAHNGTPLWNSSPIGAAVFAAPMVAKGTLFVGTWAGLSSGSTGSLFAFRPGAAPPPPPPPSELLLGDQAVEAQLDQNTAGRAEAFQATASATGGLSTLRVYVDASSTATKVVAGVFTDANGHPGALVTQGAITAITAGAFNDVPVTNAPITAGTRYWIAILGPTGTLRFRDRRGGCQSETSAQATLATLPANWSTGTTYTDCPLSAFGVG